MSESNITQDRADRVITVLAKQTSKTLTRSTDSDVAGTYHIEILEGVPKRDWAGVALDVFHTNVAVDCLDDFEFTVLDGKKELSEPDDWESYSGASKGEML